MSNEIDTNRWRACAPLLPDGGCEAVRQLCDEIDRLRTRRDELLATIVKLTNELPFPDEVKDWTAQRAKLIAEIGTLKARVVELERTTEEATPEP